MHDGDINLFFSFGDKFTDHGSKGTFVQVGQLWQVLQYTARLHSASNPIYPSAQN